MAEGDGAPSTAPRVWFGHHSERWHGFRERYFDELPVNPGEVMRLLDLVSAGRVTLVFGARDAEHNNAVASAEHLASL